MKTCPDCDANVDEEDCEFCPDCGYEFDAEPEKIEGCPTELPTEAAEEPQEGVETRTLTRTLRVRLLPQELAAKADELAHTIQEVDHLEEEKKSVTAGMKHKIDEATARRSGLAAIVSSGSDYLPVQCRQVLDRIRKRVTYIRLDTGEELEDRAMFESELQRNLPMEDEEL